MIELKNKYNGHSLPVSLLSFCISYVGIVTEYNELSAENIRPEIVVREVGSDTDFKFLQFRNANFQHE